MTGMPSGSPRVVAMRAALIVARKTRDTAATVALRTALAAIANAEAVPVEPSLPTGLASDHVAGAVAGLGAAEVPRRRLSAEQERALVLAELTEREAAAARYRGLGHAEHADQLIAEADALRPFLDLPEVSAAER